MFSPVSTGPPGSSHQPNFTTKRHRTDRPTSPWLGRDTVGWSPFPMEGCTAGPKVSRQLGRAYVWDVERRELHNGRLVTLQKMQELWLLYPPLTRQQVRVPMML